MRRAAIAVVAVLSVAWVATAGHAAIIPFCCACLAESAQQPDTGGPAGKMSIPALFCAAAINESPAYQAIVQRCDDEHGSLQCIADKETPETCPAQLLEEGFACPATGPAAAPALSPLVLGLLALGLAGLGVRLTRRIGRAR